MLLLTKTFVASILVEFHSSLAHEPKIPAMETSQNLTLNGPPRRKDGGESHPSDHIHRRSSSDFWRNTIIEYNSEAADPGNPLHALCNIFFATKRYTAYKPEQKHTKATVFQRVFRFQAGLSAFFFAGADDLFLAQGVANWHKYILPCIDILAYVRVPT